MRRKAPAALFGTALLAGLVALAWMRAPAAPARVTISIVGTNDLHGGIAPDPWARGGLTVFGGYVANLRAARAADGGAVLLLDAGDTFQATTATMRGLESNLSEGGVVVDAYNALGYDAMAIGNHDFEFGAADTGPRQTDLRGALESRSRPRAVSVPGRESHRRRHRQAAGMAQRATRPRSWRPPASASDSSA